MNAPRPRSLSLPKDAEQRESAVRRTRPRRCLKPRWPEPVERASTAGGYVGRSTTGAPNVRRCSAVADSHGARRGSGKSSIVREPDEALPVTGNKSIDFMRAVVHPSPNTFKHAFIRRKCVQSLQIRAEAIREGEEYQGIRVRLAGNIGRYHSVIGLDVSFGDPIWPAPQQVEVPRLLDGEGVNPVKVLGYPLATVIAERTVTMMQRGEANTRWRHFADIIAISRRHTFTSGAVRSAVDAVGGHRTI